MALNEARRRDAEWRRQEVYRIIRSAQKFLPVFTFSEIIEEIRKKADNLKDCAKQKKDDELAQKYEKIMNMHERSIRRYLDNLINQEKKIILVERNQYCTDTAWKLIKLIENAFQYAFLDKLSVVWDTKAMDKMWNELTQLRPEWKNADYFHAIDKGSEWIENYLKVYLGTSMELHWRQELDHSVAHHILEIVKVLALMMGKISPFLSDVGFKMIISFDPRPISLQKNNVCS